MKIDFEKFSGEPEDWNAWSKVNMAQISALEYEDVLTTPAAQDGKVGEEDYDGSQVHPETLRKASSCLADHQLQERRLRDRSRSGLAQPGLAPAHVALQSEWRQGMATVGTGLLFDEDGTR